MALQSEVSPPMVGDPNKDTKNDGDTKSDENDSTSTEEEVDLEEGEILDSGEEAEEEKKDLTNSSLKEAVDKNLLKNIEALLCQAKSDVSPPPTAVPKNLSPHNSPIKMNKRSKYLDHDRFESNSDQEDGWYSPSRKHKPKFDSGPIDYRKELEQYIGTPPSSPDRKHRDEKKKRRSKKSKKSGKKTIKRKGIKGELVRNYIKEANKRKMCKFFKEGKCAKGADCGFSHSSPKPFKKKELCKFYLSGHCNKGQDCLYMHNEFPCKFYHTGSECYAKDDCRFSHVPLTDETKRILNDYLKIHHGDDDYDRDRKRRRSPSPEPQKPPVKRTCLLGSPPRHIREAEETKRWQEEMLHNQMNHPGFKIHIGVADDGSPPPFQKPNFYQETMPSTPSPKRHRMNPDVPIVSGSNNYPTSGFGMSDIDERIRPSPSDIFVYEEDYQDLDEQEPPDYIKQEPPDFSWNNMPVMDHNPPPIKTEMEPFVDPAQQDQDFTNDVKFDETTQFSEMESSTDCSPTSPRNSTPPSVIKQESDEENSNQGNNTKSEDYKTTDDSSSGHEPVVAPIVVPSHLPKKQQELFKRIQQHQLKHAVASDASSSPKAFDASEVQVKEEPEDENDKPEAEKAESLWYSSEDDDDDDTEPLTDVLKKLQKEPPPKVESKPAANLLDMLNKIHQKSLEKNKGTPDLQQGAFFKNLLGTISTPVDTLHIPGLNLANSDTMRRTALLPDPQPTSIVKEPIIAPKDPRLKNRDPRLANASNTASSLPIAKTIALEQNILKVSSSLPNQEFSTTFTNTTMMTEPVIDDIPYKLHGIYTRPPNYASYISASQNNPSLLKDPRLRKHMNLAQSKVNGVENSKDIDAIKTLPVKNAPPIPKLLLKYDKSDSLSINIFESTSSAKLTAENSQDFRPQLPKLLDPRMRRRESQNSSGSNTPPHLTIVETSSPPVSNLRTAPILEKEIKSVEEKKWLPPVLEKKSWALPVLETTWTPLPIKQEVDSDEDNPMRLQIDENSDSSSDKVSESSTVLKKAKPVPASHLPRAIADPRMAKLHTPLDSRRSRVSTPESSNKNASELKKVSQNSENSSRLSPVDTAAGESESSKNIKSIPKKSQSNKSGEKKKPIHRNRKSSMDYASPLNSCDDSNSNKSLNYNSYNLRAPRTGISKASTDSTVSNTTTNAVISEATPDFLSDNSNLECDNSSDVNLKDMFKTIDPTASPFC